MTAPSLQLLSDRARKSLSCQRFLHVLGVTHMAVVLAHLHGCNAELAAVAGLFHDISKPISPSQIEVELTAWGIEIAEVDKPLPAIWHGLHGAAILRRDYGEFDGIDEIAEAIEFHSTSKAGIGLLGRILFIADFIEPSRRIEGIEELRLLARHDIEAAYREVLERKCTFIRDRAETPSPRALEALEQSRDGAKLPR